MEEGSEWRRDLSCFCPRAREFIWKSSTTQTRRHALRGEERRIPRRPSGALTPLSASPGVETRKRCK